MEYCLAVLFQYNSCYCSMKKILLSYLKQLRFNTTLVTVLLGDFVEVVSRMIVFQYNSCYCSMKAVLFYFSKIPMFQYNSCYCSIDGMITFRTLSVLVSIQLLLLFYYFTSFILYKISCFNTTLVTVLSQEQQLNNWIPCRFQYNSCYCSIGTQILSMKDIDGFQYNSCYCSIRYNDVKGLCECMFQYNSCYCSIVLETTYTLGVTKFQYNSCYCSISSAQFKNMSKYAFQYNSCYCSIRYVKEKRSESSRVSIQLLLLFY